MLRVGRILTRLCGQMTRREMLRAGAIPALGLSLADLFKLRAGAAAPMAKRSMILLWLWGGPSQLDTFDMKPAAPLEYRGPYRPVATNVSGIEICELLPRLARCADKFAIFRSLRHQTNDHGIGGTVGLTSSQAGAISLGGQTVPGRLQPTHGAIVSRMRGFRPDLPTFVSIGGRLHQGHRPIAGEGGGSLGSLYDPFRLEYDPDEGVRIPELDIIDGLSPAALDDRRALLRRIETIPRQLEASRSIERLDEFYQQAFSLLLASSARRFFDVADEPEALRNQYGRFRFGQCCLMARRLVEAGVAFVQVNWSSHVEPIEDAGDGGWDTHDRNYPQLQDRHAWMLDQSLSALLGDLDGRGLLESTLVLAVGEFGRTPKINVRAGRDHWEHCYSGLVAGGGVRCGQVIGASDKLGQFPATRPLSPGDLAATLYAQLGIGTVQLTQAGLTPPGELIEELV
ncbi:MAG TPA: DUF1501 domain-containing protein [Planctomycetaceae bacterium]|nr:DUF1501 domain-containing protein [Planctomycetaceae bacterium]